MSFIIILCLLSSSLDKVTSMYKIPCFHPVCRKHQDVWVVKICFFIYGEFMFKKRLRFLGSLGK